jgi:hypothetical protein
LCNQRDSPDTAGEESAAELEMYLHHQDIAQYEASCAKQDNDENGDGPTEEDIMQWTDEMISEQEELSRCLENKSDISKDSLQEKVARWKETKEFRTMVRDSSSPLVKHRLERPRIVISPNQTPTCSSDESACSTPDSYVVAIHIPQTDESEGEIINFTVGGGAVEKALTETQPGTSNSRDPHRSLHCYQQELSPNISERLPEGEPPPPYTEKDAAVEALLRVEFQETLQDSPASPSPRSQLGGPISPKGVKRELEDHIDPEVEER